MSEQQTSGRNWFGPKTPDHPSIGTPCPLCGVPFAAGDWTGLVAMEPGSPEDAAKAAAGRAYTARAVELHQRCIEAAARAWLAHQQPRAEGGGR